MSLEAWLAAQEAASAGALAAAISATDLSHERPGFGQIVTPALGSVLASRTRALWDPDPDYFYHWVRDAAVVMLAARMLRQLHPAGWDRRFGDYAEFSLGIATRAAPAANPRRARTRDSHARFLRPDAELAALSGDALLGEPRANADGTVDFEDWTRPQFDGPALRALSCLRWPVRTAAADAVLALDLGHVLRHAARACIGPWEDPPPAVHAFVLLAQRAALAAGAAADLIEGAAVAAAQERIEAALTGLVTDAGHLRASSAAGDGDSDANIVLASLLGDDDTAPFGVLDPRLQATARHVEAWSRAAFPIAAATPLVGRWPGDRFFGGNPWLPTSFGFAEFQFRTALASEGSTALAAFAHGDRILAGVRAFVPQPGALPEQLAKDSGAWTACRDLTWSHAALLAAAAARRSALRRLGHEATETP